jgi:mevalonate kinase
VVEAFSNDRQLGAKRVKPFFTETYAKWIMAGEHAVLRGCPALAFPLTSRTLRLDYRPGSETQTVEFAGPHGEDLRLLFHGVIESALSRLDIPRPLTGHFRIESALPVGAGLGASAGTVRGRGPLVRKPGLDSRKSNL